MIYTKEQTASLFVDPQKGFTPICPNELPVEGGDEIVPALLEQLNYSHIHTASKDAHNRNAIWVANEKQKQFDPIQGDNVDVCWNAHCNIGEKGFEFLDGLPNVTEYDYFIWKGIELDMHPYGACFYDFAEKLSTGLIEFYKHNNIKQVIVGGLATEYCVLTTVKQLIKAGFKIILNLDGCKGIAPDTTENALKEMYKLNVDLYNADKLDNLVRQI